jgi:hypothetical protein
MIQLFDLSIRIKHKNLFNVPISESNAVLVNSIAKIHRKFKSG